MSPRRLKTCAEPGCWRLTTAARCEEHAIRHYPKWSASERGYGSEWRKRRARVLAEHPMCQWVGCTLPATDVDHILSKSLGGTDDHLNLRALCAVHHRLKTATDAGRRRAVRKGAPRPSREAIQREERAAGVGGRGRVAKISQLGHFKSPPARAPGGLKRSGFGAA